MSHFVVLVFGDDHEKALDPFWELDLTQNDASRDYRATFTDCTEEIVNDWENGTDRMVKTPDGRLIQPYDNELRNGDSIGLSSDSHHIPEGYTEVEIPMKERYDSIEQYASDYHGYGMKTDDLTGEKQYGYWANDNAKWDWYSVGGRWSGYFKVKPDVEPVVGESGVFGNQPKPGYADQCRIKDIDFESMFDDAMREAMETYDKFEKATEGIEIPPKWDTIREELFPDDIDTAREVHNNHPWTKALRDARLDVFMGCSHEYYFVGNGGRDAFVENSKCRALLPFAVLLDGKWYEKGEMGWWGMVADEKTQYDWSAKFAELWETLDPETIVTAVDCHI